jgi:hypothetical protein
MSALVRFWIALIIEREPRPESKTAILPTFHTSNHTI